jgi:hypothetical protein
LAVLAITVAACGSDDAGPATSTVDESDTTAPTPEGLPPASALDLEPIYGEALAALGLRLTDRGGLIDRSGGGYEPSPTGTHLALYVEPIGERTTAEYIDGIADVAVVFSDVFDRWAGLVTYDVCQEPVDAEANDYGREPPPVTQIELTRDEAAAVDWSTVTVEEMVAASLADPPGLALRVSSTLALDPAYEAIAGGEGW